MIRYFTDASYSPQTGLGVIVIKKVIDKEVIDYIQNYQGFKNSELEKIGIDFCIHNGKIEHPNTEIQIFTDCESSLSNYTLLPDVSVQWIRGHLPKRDRIQENDQFFREVDLKARKELRKLVLIHNSNK